MARRIFGQLLALAIAIAIAIWLAELWLFVAVLILESFAARPFAAIAGLLLFCGVVFLCVAGSRMTAWPAIYYITRAILLLLSSAAAVASAEFILTALVTLAIGFQNAELQDYLWAICGLALVAIAAAGIRYVFAWPIAYWIVFAGLLAAVVVTIIAIQLGIVFS